MVQMKHPKLPANQTIEVPEISVAHHKRSGWQVVQGKPVEKSPEKPVENKPVGKAEAKPNNTEGES